MPTGVGAGGKRLLEIASCLPLRFGPFGFLSLPALLGYAGARCARDVVEDCRLSAAPEPRLSQKRHMGM